MTGDQKWTRNLDVTIPANASTVLAEIETADFSAATNSFLFAELDCGDETRSDVFFPNFWKEVPWPDPKLAIDGIKCVSEGIVDVTIKASTFARCVHLEGINEGCADGEPVIVEDAFFDLRAGESRTIRLKSVGLIDTQKISVAHWLMEWGKPNQVELEKEELISA